MMYPAEIYFIVVILMEFIFFIHRLIYDMHLDAEDIDYVYIIGSRME